MLDNNNIYLAGGATHDPEFALEWRERATTLLPTFNCISPFRGKEGHLNPEWNSFDPNEIVVRDLRDVFRSKLVLAEMCVPNYNYIGTCMEIRSAADAGIPVVIWTDQYAMHYWIRYHTVKALPTLEECCDYINQYWKE